MHGQLDQLQSSMEPGEIPSKPMLPVSGVRAANRRLYHVYPSGGGEDALDLAQPGALIWAQTQEEWDGDSTVSVKLLNDGTAGEATVVIRGTQARPYIKSGDIVPAYYDGGALKVVFEPGEPVRTYRWVDIAKTTFDGTGEWKWWRACDGTAITVDYPALFAGTMNGENAPNIEGKGLMDYKQGDADFGTLGGTGGVKGHNDGGAEGHDDHTVNFPANAGADGGETVSVGQVAPDGAHAHAPTVDDEEAHTHTVDDAEIFGALTISDTVKSVDNNLDGTHVDVGVDAALVASGTDATTSAEGSHNHGLTWPDPADGEHRHTMSVTTNDHTHSIGGTQTLAHTEVKHLDPYGVGVLIIKVA